MEQCWNAEGSQGLGEQVWEAVFRAAVMSAERRA